ncbi:MAG: hemolysin family protein [Actinobacteria bacterium]|nr:hemolysin family protein [Actinomycetota bacterium]
MTASEVMMLSAAAALALVAAFFAAARTALSSMSLHRAERLAADGRRGAERAARLLRGPTPAPARTLNILALVVLAAEVTAVALLTVVLGRHLGGGVEIAAAVAVGTAVLFVVADVVPRTVALQRPDEVSCGSALWVSLVARPLAPLASVLIGVGSTLVPGRRLRAGPYVTEDEIREMIDVAEEGEVIREAERAMIHSIFDLADTVVREIMVPRPDMVMASVDQPLSDVLELIIQHGHSRIPMFRSDRDTIVGVLYAKDVLGRMHAKSDEMGSWEELLRPPYFVPELKPVGELLTELREQKVHLAVVVDEYGATAGLVTIEDILEEIVGEIVDEHDPEVALVEALDEGAYRVDARLPVDELSELVDMPLPDEEWDTVGGLLFGLLGHVPSPGEQVEVQTLQLTAERVEDRRIATVLVERGVRADAEDAAGGHG